MLILFHCFALQCGQDRSFYLYSTRDLLSVVNRWGIWLEVSSCG